METLSKAKVVVLASGRGSNFEALAKAVSSHELSRVALTGLICNVPQAGALAVAARYHIPSFLIPSAHHEKNWDRAGYEAALLAQLQTLAPDWICLAGYLLLLGPSIVRQYPQKILNIHPSLLPKYPGLKAQRQALAAQEQETGCTVHWVTEELDEGPILLQKKLSILPGDTEHSLSERLLTVEHQTYVEALRLLTEPTSHLKNHPQQK